MTRYWMVSGTNDDNPMRFYTETHGAAIEEDLKGFSNGRSLIGIVAFDMPTDEYVKHKALALGAFQHLSHRQNTSVNLESLREVNAIPPGLANSTSGGGRETCAVKLYEEKIEEK